MYAGRARRNRAGCGIQPAVGHSVLSTIHPFTTVSAPAVPDPLPRAHRLVPYPVDLEHDLDVGQLVALAQLQGQAMQQTFGQLNNSTR